MEGAEAPSQGATELQRLREELQNLKHQNAELRSALQEACLSTLQPDAAQYVQVMSLTPQSRQLVSPCLHTTPGIQLHSELECLLRACTTLLIEPYYLSQDSMGSAVASLAVADGAPAPQEPPAQPLHIRPSAGQPMRHRCNFCGIFLLCRYV